MGACTQSRRVQDGKKLHALVSGWVCEQLAVMKGAGFENYGEH